MLHSTQLYSFRFCTVYSVHSLHVQVFQRRRDTKDKQTRISMVVLACIDIEPPEPMLVDQWTSPPPLSPRRGRGLGVAQRVDALLRARVRAQQAPPVAPPRLARRLVALCGGDLRVGRDAQVREGAAARAELVARRVAALDLAQRGDDGVGTVELRRDGVGTELGA